MIPANTDINLRQAGALRIEMVAITMLLMALAMVLVTNMPPARQPDIAQAYERVRVLPTAHATSGLLAAPQLQLQPTVVAEPDAP